MTKVFSPEAMDRIRSAVRHVEQTGVMRHPLDADRRFPSMLPSLAVAGADIEHNATGPVKLASGSSWDFAATSSTDIEREAFNPGLPIWNGSKVLVEHTALAGGRPSLVVTRAWSATRVRGTATGTISGGGSGAISSVVSYDGQAPGSISVFNPSSNDITSGSTVIAELDSGGTWVASVPAPVESGGGGGGGSNSHIGFNELKSSQTTIGNSSREVVIWDADDLLGSLTGVTFDASENAFTFGTVADYMIDYYGAGSATCATYEGHVNTEGPRIQYADFTLQEKVGAGSWGNVADSRLQALFYSSGTISGGSRRFMYRPSSADAKLRLTVIASQTFPEFCDSINLFHASLFISKAVT